MPKDKNSRKKYNTEALKSPETLQTFKLELKNRFEALGDFTSETVEETWTTIKSTVNEISQEVLGCKKQESKPRITNSTLQLIKEARTKTLDNPSQEELDEYNELRRSVKHQLKRDKRNYYENLAAEGELASAQNRMQQYT